jgi:hypothetical protein
MCVYAYMRKEGMCGQSLLVYLWVYMHIHESVCVHVQSFRTNNDLYTGLDRSRNRCVRNNRMPLVADFRENTKIKGQHMHVHGCKPHSHDRHGHAPSIHVFHNVRVCVYACAFCGIFSSGIMLSVLQLAVCMAVTCSCT